MPAASPTQQEIRDRIANVLAVRRTYEAKLDAPELTRLPFATLRENIARCDATLARLATQLQSLTQP